MKLKKTKVIAVLPAFNAADSLEQFFENFPFKFFDEVILVDDGSGDMTLRVIREIRGSRGIRVFKNSKNLGYGGNMKRCLSLALKAGADIVVEIHPDGEYGFDGIEPALKLVSKRAKFVLGNRFAENNPQGMPSWKIPFTRALSKIANLILGTNIPDLHQGFRVYSRELLGKIDFKNYSDDYIFSFEIIAQAALKKIPIESVAVSTNYRGQKRGASFKSSIYYSLGVLGILGKFSLVKMGLKRQLF